MVGIFFIPDIKVITITAYLEGVEGCTIFMTYVYILALLVYYITHPNISRSGTQILKVLQ